MPVLESAPRPEVLTAWFEVLLLSPRPFRTDRPRTQDAFQLVALFLQFAAAAAPAPLLLATILAACDPTPPPLVTVSV